MIVFDRCNGRLVFVNLISEIKAWVNLIIIKLSLIFIYMFVIAGQMAEPNSLFF